MGILGDIGGFIMTPLYYAISAVLLAFHYVFDLIPGFDEGLSWALSIVGLTLVIRAALIPLFVRQIKAQRNMQLIQPKVKELQKKYGHDRQKLGEETMKLYKDAGTNPFASCLPLIIQMPIFFALFRLINKASRGESRGFLSRDQAAAFGQSRIFDLLPIDASFTHPLGIDPVAGETAHTVLVRIVAAILVLMMTATTFTTQRQLMSKNMPADALSGQYAQQQKMLLYVLPLVFGVGGIAFPIGVLLYWTTSNLWTMGQQFYVIRNNPAPGTPAFKAKLDRDRAKGHRTDEGPEAEGEGGTPAKGSPTKPGSPGGADRRPPQRQQPKRQTKSQRRQTGSAPGKPSSGGASASTNKRGGTA